MTREQLEKFANNKSMPGSARNKYKQMLKDLDEKEGKTETPKKEVKKTAKKKAPKKTEKKETTKTVIGKKDADFEVKTVDGNATLVVSKHNSNWVATIEKHDKVFKVKCCSDDMEHPDFASLDKAIFYCKDFLYCKFLFSTAKEKAKKRRSKKSVEHAKDLKTDVSATLEDTVDAIETKVEKKQSKGETFNPTERTKIKKQVSDIVNLIIADIKTAEQRREWLDAFIKELQGMKTQFAGGGNVGNETEFISNQKELKHYKNLLRNIDKYPDYNKKNVEIIISELEDKVKEFAGGGTLYGDGKIYKYDSSGNVKEVRDVNGKLLKETEVKNVKYRRNSTYKTYNSIEDNKLLHQSHIGNKK